MVIVLYTNLKELIQEYNLSTKQMEVNRDQAVAEGRATAKIPLEEILVEDSTYTNINRLKIRLVNEGHLKYKCNNCKNEGKWLGETLSLQLDHINGEPSDHRIENLRFLCSNCHSQTSTYCGRNNK